MCESRDCAGKQRTWYLDNMIGDKCMRSLESEMMMMIMLKVVVVNIVDFGSAVRQMGYTAVPTCFIQLKCGTTTGER